ncbi:MFS transporter [Actinoplanes sp. KI2]|uniref:MFS transporter n=1 Tax=Actinoplanes sp. KI2 TaxID=2983315 RepID=UPI0021D58016|nr:MFS transporter [Actinoplanes sp. KI2]MCU7730691.1 MFS transporter [Actinoplanes sp. KI2]
MSSSTDLRLYWWGHTASALGSAFTGITLPILAVVHFGASPGQVGLISAAAVLPMLVLGLPAGILADRIRRPRRALIVIDTLSAAAVAAVTAGVATHVASIGWLVALCAAQGCVGVFLETVYFIHLRQLVDDAQLGTVRARLQAGQYAAGIIGRLLAGPTIVAFGPAAALAVDGISYLVSATTLVCMTPLATPLPPAGARLAAGYDAALRALTTGLRFCLGDPVRRVVLVALFVPGAALAGTAALTAPFLLQVVRVPVPAYGWLFMASGLAGLAGSVVAGRLLASRRDPRAVLLAASGAAALAGVLLPLAGGPIPVATGLAAAGIGLPALFAAVGNVALGPVIVADADEGTLGRILSALQVLGAATGLLGAVAGGVLGDLVGVRQALWLLQLGALAAVLVCVPPALRAARRARRAAAPASVDRAEASDLARSA